MYITGDQFDFLNRLHALPNSTDDLAQFATEYSGYVPSADLADQYRWLREGNKWECIYNLDTGTYFA
jgi:hypothetical protein